MQLFRQDIDRSKYILATYYVESTKTLRDAAWDIAIGQSMGNPSIRNEWETEDLFEKHSCFIMAEEDKLKATSYGSVTIAFPESNIDWEEDGISQLLCHLMGGQLDIDHIRTCRLIAVQFPQRTEHAFTSRPRVGMRDIRAFTQCWDRPLLGAIVKPKVVDSEETLRSIVGQLMDGGVNFIKEDEIMSNPSCLKLAKRIRIVEEIRQNRNIYYAYCINSDPCSVFDKAKAVLDGGGNAIHINFWSGLGVYNSLRKKFPELLIHFQKSGDKILTSDSHRYSITWPVICQLAGLMGVSTIHAGMIGGYSSDDPTMMQQAISTLHKYDVVPALSCGMHPGLIDHINKQIGVNYMANVGGAIHGHPGGTKAGALAMRQAIDKTGGKEYDDAIAKWGKK